MTFDLDRDLEVILSAVPSGDLAVNVRWRSSHLPARTSNFCDMTKLPYHVTVDLDLDLEHILDAGLPGEHCVQVWLGSSNLHARISDFRDMTKVPISHDL